MAGDNYLNIEEREDGFDVVAPLREASGDSGSVGCSVILFLAFIALVSAILYLIVKTFNPNDLRDLGVLYIFVPALAMIGIIAVSALLSAPRYKRLHIEPGGEWELETYAARRFSSDPRLVRDQTLAADAIRRVEVVESDRRGRPVLVIQGPDDEFLFGDILASRVSESEFDPLGEQLRGVAERAREVAASGRGCR